MVRTGARRIGPREAELLVQWAPEAGHPALRRLLRLAAAPPHAGELRGGATAAASMASTFRESGARRRSRRPLTVLSRALAVKVAVVVGVALLGGTAVAAGTEPVREGLRSVFVPRPPVGTDAARSYPSATFSSPRRETPPAVPGLCRAWSERRGPGRSPDPVLVAAAGGADKVPAFCAAVLGISPSPDPSTPVPSPTPSPTPTPKHPAAVPTPSHPGPPADPGGGPGHGSPKDPSPRR